MTGKKLQLDGNKIVYHMDKLAKWKKGESFAPITIEFGPTSYCNHKCIHCYVQDQIEPVSIDPEIYKRFMREIGDYGVESIILGGTGEPMLHKTTPSSIEIATSHGTEVGMYTNGVPMLENQPFFKQSLQRRLKRLITHSVRSNQM